VVPTSKVDTSIIGPPVTAFGTTFALPTNKRFFKQSNGCFGIDVLIEQGAETGVQAKKALMALPDQVAKSLDPAWFASGDRVRVADAFQVDLMLNAGGHTWDSLRRFEEVINVQGVPVKALRLEGLRLTRAAL